MKPYQRYMRDRWDRKDSNGSPKARREERKTRLNKGLLRLYKNVDFYSKKASERAAQTKYPI